jgi:hypothetical protein
MIGISDHVVSPIRHPATPATGHDGMHDEPALVDRSHVGEARGRVDGAAH